MKRKTIRTDVVIVGGSIAGMSAAIRAKEQNPDLAVTVVEKYFSGYAGKANRGGGILICLADKAAPEEFAKFHTEHIGEFLNNQEILYDYASKMDRNIEWLDKWSNGKVSRGEDGSISYGDWGGEIIGTYENGMPKTAPSPLPWTLAAIELDFLLEMKKTALKAGVRFIDRVGIVDLLTCENTIAGCVGYHIETGEVYVFEARAVILACGSQNYRILPMWAPGRGEGIAAAYRAGAKLANTEFGSFCNWLNTDNYEAMMGCELAMYNDAGEKINTDLVLSDYIDISAQSIANWYKQMQAGNGPMHYHAEENSLLPSIAPMLAGDTIYRNRPFADKFWNTLFFNAGTNASNDEILPGFIGELSPVWVDADFTSSIRGLLCAGDICYTASGAVGAVPAPPSRTRGGGLGFALYSGIEAGENAALYAEKADFSTVCEAQISKSYADMFEPMGRDTGIHPDDFLEDLQAVIGDVGNSVYKSRERLEAASRNVDALEKRLNRLKAADMHEVFLCNEVKSMVLCAQMFFRSSLLRTESRGWFLREDYPARNDEEWLKWSVVKNNNGKMEISYEPVPIGTYPVQPEKEVQ